MASRCVSWLLRDHQRKAAQFSNHLMHLNPDLDPGAENKLFSPEGLPVILPDT